MASLPVWVAPAMALSGIGALAIAVAVLWASGGGSTAVEPSATPTQRPASTSTPEDPLGAVPLIVGDPVPFPENMSMLVMKVPYNKSWGVLSVERWTRGTGAVLRETVFDPGENYISGVASDGRTIYLGLVTGECPYCLPTSDPGRFTAVYRSTDGGMTWAGSDPVDGVWFPTVADESGVVLRNLSGPTVAYGRLQDGEMQLIEPPANGDANHLPLVVDGRLAWQHTSDAALVDSGGTVLEPDFHDPLAFKVSSLLPRETGVALTWTNWMTPTNEQVHYIVDAQSSGGRSLAPRRALRSAQLPRIVDTLGDQLLVSLQWFEPDGPPVQNEGITPTLIDFESATAFPIAEFREHYVAIVPILADAGPFLRVNAPGDCLNVRATAGMEARVIACVSDGVLLVDREDVWDRDGVTWLAVRTPFGESGWASAEFLVR